MEEALITYTILIALVIGLIAYCLQGKQPKKFDEFSGNAKIRSNPDDWIPSLTTIHAPEMSYNSSDHSVGGD